jgi:hypothetical protein
MDERIKAYQEVERTFWERRFGDEHRDDDARFKSQYRTVFQRLIPKIRRFAEDERLSAENYDVRLLKAEGIVDEIAYALNTGFIEEKEGSIWCEPRPEDVVGWPDTLYSDRASPVDISSLDAATARYLQRPWMQLNRLDWYILNGYIFDEAAKIVDHIRSGRAIGVVNLAYIFGGGDLDKTVYWRAALDIAKFVMRWIMLPVAIALVYYFGYQQAAMWIAVPYGVYLAIHIALFPRRYLRRRAQKKELKEWESAVNALVRVYQTSSCVVFSPTQLRSIIVEAESGRARVKSAVYSLLDRAIERDPAVFTVEDER